MIPKASTRTPWPLPVLHFLAGLSAFVPALLLLAADPGPLLEPYIHNSGTLWRLHLLTIGWVSMMMLGALYQLLPVRMQSPLYSVGLGAASGVLLLVGEVLLFYGFSRFSTAVLAAGGALTAAGLILAAYNHIRTVLRSSAPTGEKRFFYAAAAGLTAVAALGLALAVNLHVPYFTSNSGYFYHLRLHAAAGAGLWFGGIAFGVGYQLVPMFALSPELPDRRTGRVFWLLIGTAVLTGAGLPAAGALLMLAAAALFLFDLRTLILTRRKPLDLSLTGTLLAAGWLAVTCLTALVLLVLYAAGRSSLFPGSLDAGIRIVAFLYLLGWLSGLILAQLYKILPFLIWVHVYGPRVGKQPVPTMQQLSRPVRDRWALYLYHAGVAVAACGFAAEPLLRPGLAIMFLGGLGMALACLDLLRPLAGGDAQPAAPPPAATLPPGIGRGGRTGTD